MSQFTYHYNDNHCLKQLETRWWTNDHRALTSNYYPVETIWEILVRDIYPEGECHGNKDELKSIIKILRINILNLWHMEW